VEGNGYVITRSARARSTTPATSSSSGGTTPSSASPGRPFRPGSRLATRNAQSLRALMQQIEPWQPFG